MKFNTALVLSFAAACLGKAFSTTASPGHQRLARRDADSNCVNKPSVTIYRRFVRKIPPTNVVESLKEEAKKNERIDKLKNDAAEHEKLKMWSEAAEKYQELAEASSKPEDKKNFDDKVTLLKELQVFEKEAKAAEMEAEVLKSDGKFEQAAEKFRDAAKKFTSAQFSDSADRMTKAANEMDVQAQAQTDSNSQGDDQPSEEKGGLKWLWIVLGVIAGIVILGGIVYFVIKR
ncbi:hypothetical protein DSO57_1016685 [Entomophthora muscae]|uniref:Uncharacterized protein n=1 Tax=Entomophthora muscae TaxID=34485 RepID=A0ACC2RJE2_9FUNG|nr:hypothetical protein DSO57_1016685 [Entomophthora muscae]